MKISKPIVITFYAVIGLAGFILSVLRISNGLYLDAAFSTLIFGFCAYRLFVTLRSD